jgi:hypothetical protein
MKDELQKTLSEFIQRIVSGIDGTVNFMDAQLPDYITQLLVWYGVYNLILFILGLAMMAFVPYYLIKIMPIIAKKEAEVSIDAAVTYVFSAIGSVLMSIFSACTMNVEWLKVYLAPKVWLVDYAAGLIK